MTDTILSAARRVRVVGGGSEFQFVERRMPTLAEVDAAAPRFAF